MKTPKLLIKPCAYKASKLYAILPDNGDGDGVVTGAGANGTRVNKYGYIEQSVANVPRIDYLGKPGLLIEPTRTNQFTYSDTITGQFTIDAGCTVSDDDTISPDGTKNAAKIADATDADFGSINKSITVTDGTALHAFSFFVKFGNISTTEYWITNSASTEFAWITINDDGSTSIRADANSIITRVGSENYGNGWWRFHCTIDMNNTDTAINAKVYCSGPDNDKQGYVWVWGFQLEEGDLRTSYIPSPTTAVIRSAETVTTSSMVTNGIMGDYANGSLYVDMEHEEQIASVETSAISIGNSATSIEIRFDNLLEYPTLFIKNSASLSFQHTATTKRIKAVFNLFGDDAEAWLNGTKVIEAVGDTTLPTDDLVIDSFGGSMKVYEIAIFDKTLTDEESQKITA